MQIRAYEIRPYEKIKFYIYFNNKNKMIKTNNFKKNANEFNDLEKIIEIPLMVDWNFDQCQNRRISENQRLFFAEVYKEFKEVEKVAELENKKVDLMLIDIYFPRIFKVGTKIFFRDRYFKIADFKKNYLGEFSLILDNGEIVNSFGCFKNLNTFFIFNEVQVVDENEALERVKMMYFGDLLEGEINFCFKKGNEGMNMKNLIKGVNFHLLDRFCDNVAQTESLQIFFALILKVVKKQYVLIKDINKNVQVYLERFPKADFFELSEEFLNVSTLQVLSNDQVLMVERDMILSIRDFVSFRDYYQDFVGKF